MGDRVRRWLIAAALISIAPALAADLPLEPKTQPAEAPADANPLAPPAAACLEWTDGCRICKRSADGPASCSNVGIACVPKAVTCSTTDAPAR